MSEQLKPLEDQLLDGDLTPYQVGNQLQLVHGMMDSLKQREKLLKGFMLDHLNDREELKGVFGSVTQKRGGETKWKVTDPLAYGKWLHDNGKDNMVVESYAPVEEACEAGYLQALNVENDGEVPDGVDPPKARVDTVVVKVSKDWREKVDSIDLTGEMKQNLGIEDYKMPEPQKADNGKEQDVWATV